MEKFVNMIYRIAFIAIIAVSMPAVVSAQDYENVPVEISKEKVKIDGKICYSHIVLEKQTLYSISKAYGVSIDDIISFNPGIKDAGLKKNSILIIPSAEAIVTNTKIENSAAQQEDASKGAAPAVAADTMARNVIMPDATHKTQTKRIHIAKWYENLDVIAEQYGVTVEAIMTANNLKGKKLNKRQKLLIPYPGESAGMAEETVSDKTGVTDYSELVTVEDSTLQTVAQKNKVTATIVLPMTNSEGQPNRNNMDFYCGALLAVYDIAQDGTDCILNVYDIMDNKSQLNAESLTESDFVIGPVSAADLTRTFYSAPDAKAVISPLDPRAEKLLASHTNMIQIPTPHLLQYQDLINWMEEDFKDGDRVVMITEKGARQMGISSQMKEALDSSVLAYNTFSYSILEGRDVTEPLIELMTTEGANRILIASESEAFVNDVVRNLNLLIYNNLDIVLYAPSKIRSFETIEVDNLHNTSLHASLSYFIDYESDEVKDFLLKYRALYGAEPSQFAFQGYDITKYFLSKCAEFGPAWKDMLDNSKEEMLQSTFSFRKQGTGGYTNTGVRRIIYDKGYSVRKVER